VNVAALIYVAMAVCLNYPMIWVHVGNGQRGTYEVFVTLALGLLGFEMYPRSLRVATVGFWCAAGAYVLLGAFDAASIRTALGFPL
jgi:hypothetical protein